MTDGSERRNLRMLRGIGSVCVLSSSWTDRSFAGLRPDFLARASSRCCPRGSNDNLASLSSCHEHSHQRLVLVLLVCSRNASLLHLALSQTLGLTARYLWNSSVANGRPRKSVSISMAGTDEPFSKMHRRNLITTSASIRLPPNADSISWFID